MSPWVCVPDGNAVARGRAAATWSAVHRNKTVDLECRVVEVVALDQPTYHQWSVVERARGGRRITSAATGETFRGAEAARRMCRAAVGGTIGRDAAPELAWREERKR